VNTKRYSPLTVSIYGDHSDDFVCHQSVLNEQGYKIQAYDDCKEFLSKSSSTDISIISLSLLENFDADSVAGYSEPFIVYDFSTDFPFNNANPFVYEAVGYFIEKPSPRDIGLKVEVGLLLHQERRRVSQRLLDLNQKFGTNRDIGIATGIVFSLSGLSVQESYDLLRKMARNKRCRVSDIAKALISNQATQAKLHDFESLTHWLSDLVLINLDRDN